MNFDIEDLTKICRENPDLVKSGKKKNGRFTRRAKYVLL